MTKVELIHWKPEEVAVRIAGLESAGYKVTCEAFSGPEALRRLRAEPPDAIVIDLSRLPSHGRDVGMALRQYKATRGVPLIFVEGDREKVAKVRALLPDAAYASWRGIFSTLERAISHPPRDPVAPNSIFDAYSGTPLPRKLGIKADSVVGLIRAPREFPKLLADLPEGVELRDDLRRRCDLILWFVRSRKQLEAGVEKMARRVGDAPIWIAWPKKGSGLNLDLTQKQVRSSGLAVGLVDYKICAIDATWSGLLFRRRRKNHL